MTAPAISPLLEQTRDIARNLESHLGLATRSREWNPTFETAVEFVEHESYGIEMAQASSVNRLLGEYRHQAQRAAAADPGDVAVRELAHAIQNIKTYDDAVALVRSIEEA